MAITFFQANKILDLNFGNTSYVVPATLYFGLSSTAPNANGSGVTEPVGGSYSRVAVVNNKTNFSISASAILLNASAITFPESTASWGTITHVFIADSISGGNILYYDALSTSRLIQISTTIMFSSGAVQISMTNT